MKEITGSSEIPLPTDKLILVDLDKTLIDEKYNVTDQYVLNEITRLQDMGWSIGLNSDTALEPLLLWRDRFKMNGPVIAERGSIIWIGHGKEIIFEEAADFFGELRISLLRKLATERISFLHGDVTQFIRNKPVLLGMVDDRLVLVQAFRRCSLNFYGMKIGQEGELVIDNELTRQVYETVKDIIGNSPFPLDEDVNPDYGICILSPAKMNKRVGVLRLMKELGMYRVGMIGDSTSDIVGKDIAIHYAVGNAKQGLKNVADYIATNQYSSGVAEILRAISLYV